MKNSKLEENNSVMFRNQNSNSFPVFQGTPKKFDIQQQQMYEGSNEHNNISALFPWLESNTYNKKLFQNETSQHQNMPANKKSPTKNSFKARQSNEQFQEGEDQKDHMDISDEKEKDIQQRGTSLLANFQAEQTKHQRITKSNKKTR